MKQFLSRQIVLNRLRKIRGKAIATHDKQAVKIADMAFNAVLSAPLEKQIYCVCCGKKIREAIEDCGE